MNARHAQAYAILECLRRRNIWVSIRRGELDLTPPPGNRWKRRIRELIDVMNGSKHVDSFQWEIKVWLRWERRREWRRAVTDLANQLDSVSFPTKGNK